MELRTHGVVVVASHGTYFEGLGVFLRGFAM
jgi:hypothetical protein